MMPNIAEGPSQDETSTLLLGLSLITRLDTVKINPTVLIHLHIHEDRRLPQPTTIIEPDMHLVAQATEEDRQ